MTPFFCAVKNNHVECCEVFLKKGVDINIQNEKGKTALHVACKKGSKEVLDLLLK